MSDSMLSISFIVAALTYTKIVLYENILKNFSHRQPLWNHFRISQNDVLFPLPWLMLMEEPNLKYVS